MREGGKGGKGTFSDPSYYLLKIRNHHYQHLPITYYLLKINQQPTGAEITAPSGG